MKFKLLTFVKILVRANDKGVLKERYLLESSMNIFHPEVVGVGSIVGHDYVIKMSKKVDVIINEKDSLSRFIWETRVGVLIRGNVPPEDVN